MKTANRTTLPLLALAFCSTLLSWPWFAEAQGPVVQCDDLTGAAPVLDGVVAPGEWPATPALQLRLPDYPIDTDVYCVNSGVDVYVLVDAVGDGTDTNADECLLVFDLPPNHKIVEIWREDGSPGGPIRRRFEGGAAGDSAMAFTGGHRVYEFRINLASVGARRGGSVVFYSPAFFKWPGIWASMPYDFATGRDNVFPHDLVVTTDPGNPFSIVSVSGYGFMRFAGTVGAPALNSGGMVVAVALLAILGVWMLRRPRPGRE